MSQVIIKPVPGKRWHGKEGKDSFARPVTVEVLYDEATGKYATGLDEDTRKRLEEATGLDLNDKYSIATPHEYWSSPGAWIKLPNHTMVLKDTNPYDEIKIKNLKASKYVANSLKEWEDGMFPDATHIIFDETEETELKASKIQMFNKCVVILSKMSRAEKTNMMSLLSTKSVKGRSEEFIDVELNALLDKDNAEAKTNIELFLKYAKMNPKETTTRANILEALHNNILTKEGHTIKYMGEPLGSDLNDTVAYFMDPNNQNIKVAILEKLNA